MTLSTVRIDEFASMKYGKMPKKEILRDSGYPVYSGYRITGYAKEYLYSEPKLIVVARGVGGTGDVKISPPNSWITNLSIVLELDESKVDKRYLLYKLGREPLKEKLNTGAAQAQITIDNLSSYKISIPELATQKSIVEIISKYDDLIENNKRRIELLEESARQLYKEWFVRFRFPGHEHAKIIDGVPEGWEKLTFGNAPIQIIDGDRGKNYPKQDELLDSGFCLFLSTKNVTKSGFNFSNCQFITEAKDDLLRKGKLSRDDVVMTTRGTIGNTAYFNKNIPYENLRINSGMVIFRTDSERLTPSFLYQYFRSEEFISLVNGLRSGAAQPQLPIRDIKTIEVLLPSSALMEQFGDICKVIHEQISELNFYNQRLSKARDLLLPKLMSGEIAV